MKILSIYGCGGMGREIAELAYRIERWGKIIFVDDNIVKKVVDDIRVYSFEDVQEGFDKEDIEYIVAAGEPVLRKLLYDKLAEYRLNIICIIDPGFTLSRFSSVAKGTIIHTGATITCNVHIGEGCLINKHSVIGHDVTVGGYCVISPNVSIGGDVTIGSNCYIGSGAIIRNGIYIGDNSIIGMGAVVIKDVKANSVVVGNPAKLLRENIDKRVFGK